jgi:histidinol-phosphate aminotransferase
VNSIEAVPTELRIPQRILDASPYVPEWSGLNRAEFIRLDRNENTRPLPVAVQETLVRSIGGWAVQSYPEPSPLQRSLADYTHVPMEYILSTNGSDQGIDLCLRAVLSEGDSVLVARPEFPVFSHVANAIGARIEPIPYNSDLSFPYGAFTTAIASVRPSLIVLINPNNPTGSGMDVVAYIERTIASNHKTPIIVDEAYYEYTGQTVVPLVRTYSNLIVLRTFSKAFAMAGLRVGYVIANPQMLVHVRKLQNPFDVNQLAVIAGLAQLARVDAVSAECRKRGGRDKTIRCGLSSGDGRGGLAGVGELPSRATTRLRGGCYLPSRFRCACTIDVSSCAQRHLPRKFGNDAGNAAVRQCLSLLSGKATV